MQHMFNNCTEILFRFSPKIAGRSHKEKKKDKKRKVAVWKLYSGFLKQLKLSQYCEFVHHILETPPVMQCSVVCVCVWILNKSAI